MLAALQGGLVQNACPQVPGASDSVAMILLIGTFIGASLCHAFDELKIRGCAY